MSRPLIAAAAVAMLLLLVVLVEHAYATAWAPAMCGTDRVETTSVCPPSLGGDG